MIKLEFRPKFIKSYSQFSKKDKILKKKIDKTLEQFIHNPNHTGLKLEKLSGSKTWTIRVNRPIRIFFTWIKTNKVALILDVGGHDLYRRY